MRDVDTVSAELKAARRRLAEARSHHQTVAADGMQRAAREGAAQVAQAEQRLASLERELAESVLFNCRAQYRVVDP